MQLFGTTFNMDLGSFRLRIAFGLDDRSADVSPTRVEDMPRLELTT